jgi:hypothetical protein
MRQGLILLAAALMLAALALLSFGQALDGNIVGTAVDASGAAVPSVTIELQNMDTGVKVNSRTSATGEYRFNNVLVGRYRVTASAPGFQTISQNNVVVELNKTNTLNLTMQVGTVSTTVDVTEASATIDTTTAQVQSTYDSRSMELPMTSLDVPGRNLGALNLSLLGAGVGSSGGIGVGVGPTVGGQRPRNNSFTIEGVDNNRKDVAGPNVYLPNEATQEFTLLQNQFAPEFGHSSGGQFNLVAKSGTNAIHGDIYEYNLNRNYNAVDQQNANQGVLSNPRFDQNRLGATIGGPIIKNKWFYFGDFEYEPLGRASVPSSPIEAPTAAGYATLSGLAGISQNNLGVLKQYLGSAATATDSETVLGAKIPLGITPVVAPNFTNQYTYVFTTDYNVSDKDQWRVRFVHNKIGAIDNTAQLPIFYATRPTKQYLFTLAEYHTFTPNITNEFRFGYNRYNDTIPVPNFKFPGLDAFPNVIIDSISLDLGPNDNAPQFTIINSYQFVDNVNWMKGNHNIKFGADARKLISPEQFTQRARGAYEYGSLGLYLQDLSPDVLGERSLGAPTYYGDQIASYYYINDTYRMRPNFTVNLGLRYEYTTIPHGELSQALNSVANLPGVLTFNAPQTQKTNFAPRVGLAYSPGHSGNTSIRAGFGMAYDVLFDNIGQLQLPPEFSTTHDINLSAQSPNFLAGGGIPPNFSASSNLTPAVARGLTSNYIPDQRLPYSISWNLGIQHVFAKNYTLEVRYLGSKGVHLITQSRINQVSKVNSSRYLPTYLQAPSQATLDSLPYTLAYLNSLPNNEYASLGFTNPIVSYQDQGYSQYHGLAVQFDRRFSSGLQFRGAYTWSHLIDDSTAEFFSTYLTSRRPQDFQNLADEKSASPLDRRHRFTFATVYDAPWFKSNSNWFMKNILGNFVMTAAYTFESPEYATVQSNVDSNLNGDSAGDRSIVNPAGAAGVGSGVTALKNSAGATVGYLANNPNARYIVAAAGALANAGRDTLPGPRTDNVDFSFTKSFSVTERMHLSFGMQAFNILNHPQPIPGSIDNVYPQDTHLNGRNYLIPGNKIFNDFTQAFSSNPRTISLFGRFTF